MLDPDKSNGMFVVTVPAKKDAATIEADIRSRLTHTLASHNGGTDFTWKEADVAPLEQSPAKSGTRYEGTGERKLLQVVVFHASVAGKNLMFGYFAMREAKGAGRSDDGTFLDDAAGGMPEFDAFARSIKPAR